MNISLKYSSLSQSVSRYIETSANQLFSYLLILSGYAELSFPVYIKCSLVPGKVQQ